MSASDTEAPLSDIFWIYQMMIRCSAGIFGTVSFLTLRTIKKLFFVLSCFRFYDLNFFYWNLMSRDAFIPKFSVFFRETRKKCQPGKFQENCQTEIFARNSKKYGIFGNKCFLRHQIPAEKIHLIEPEVSQNKEQFLNVFK